MLPLHGLLVMKGKFMSEIIVTNWKEHLSILGFFDGKLIFLDFPCENDRTGNIYVGRVENVVSNLNAAFVRFESNNKKHGIGFLPVKNLDPKFVLNREIKSASELRVGDDVLVFLRTEEHKTKQARLSCDERAFRKSKAFSGEDSGHMEGQHYADLEELIKTAKCRCEYQLLYGTSSDLKACILSAKEQLEKEYGLEFKLITDISSVYDELKGDSDITFYDEEKSRLPINVHYSLTSKTDDLLKKKVWLDSGAYLVIEQTETLNLIDVNSGKNLKKSDEIFLEINKEAAIEAYRQIRLRNLSGMILIDFIDLKTAEANDELIEFVSDLVKNDRFNMRFIDLTGLGIMEFTRDKKKKTLRETIDIHSM